MSSSSQMIIVGAGPAGYVAALRAAQLGFETTLIEKEHLGGVCLNWGCIPTKALLKAADVKRTLDHAASFGFQTGPVTVDLKTLVGRTRQVSEKLAGGIRGLLKKNKVLLKEGTASLDGPGRLKIQTPNGEERLTSPHILLATGARARLLPGLSLPVSEEGPLWTARQAMIPQVLPSSLAIIGSGAIGIEFASFYRTLGVDVTVIEMQSRILPQEDEEISQLAQKSFEKQGIRFLLGTQLDNIQIQDSQKGARLFLSTAGKQTTLEAERVLLAVGVVGNTENLGLETTKAKVDHHRIVTDQWGQTEEKGLYAIGDVAGAPWLAHKASHQAVMCVEKIAGLSVPPLDPTCIPGCTYSFPQIASIGLTEKQAKDRGIPLRIGRFSPMGNGKALALGDTEGLVKTLFHEQTGELLGAHLIGPEVTEMIYGLTLGKTLEATEEELIHTIFPHPTLSEMIHESVLSAYGRALHS